MKYCFMFIMIVLLVGLSFYMSSLIQNPISPAILKSFWSAPPKTLPSVLKKKGVAYADFAYRFHTFPDHQQTILKLCL